MVCSQQCKQLKTIYCANNGKNKSTTERRKVENFDFKIEYYCLIPMTIIMMF